MKADLMELSKRVCKVIVKLSLDIDKSKVIAELYEITDELARLSIFVD